jgi:hypothetical protein
MFLKNNFLHYKNLIPPFEYYKTSLNHQINTRHLTLSLLPTYRKGPCKFRTVRFQGLHTLRCHGAIRHGSSFDLLSPFLAICRNATSFPLNAQSLIPPPTQLPCQQPFAPNHLHTTKPIVDSVPQPISNERGAFKLNDSPLTSLLPTQPDFSFRMRCDGDFRNCYEVPQDMFPNTNKNSCECPTHRNPIPESHPGILFHSRKIGSK